MDVVLRFLGAAQSVTGSKYYLEVNGEKYLVDCGMFQGLKQLRLRNWDRLPIDPKDLSAVIITHAHIDHTGYLPRLVKDGFHGRIICTNATADLMKIMLLDAAKLQEEEAVHAFKKGYSRHASPQPLFTTLDAENVLTMVESYRYDAHVQVSKHFTVQFRNAGHILGSAIVEGWLLGDRMQKKIVFSGDLGRFEDPVMYPPTLIEEADVLLTESTYGNRVSPQDHVEEDLARVINEAWKAEGCVVIPAFAVGRTQSLLYYLLTLMDKKAIPVTPIFVDSPMAISVTDLYEHHRYNHKIEVTRNGDRLHSIFDSPNVHFCNSQESSKALNDIKRDAIIISASGMCTGGRILHHMFNRLPRANDTFLFVGYQGEGTRGRDLLDGETSIRMFGALVPVNCQVREVHGLSAHADQHELVQWLSGFKQAPKRTFITHGEITTSTALQEIIRQQFGWDSTIPSYLESFMLFQGI
ncbi:MAG: MBL fold metallo-hydrolase [Cyclobacteriaceae bacterium]|nr:MBL fold metallo-hydrolase [Cyclobacteriaceae bacterium]